MFKKGKYNLKLKNALFFGMLLLLCLPLAQRQTKLISLPALQGSFVVPPPPDFSFDAWFEGKYQTAQQNHFKQTIGFRSVFVRIYNQLHYSLYNRAHANGVFIGKNNYLYEENDLKSHLGIDFIGHKKIAEKVRKLANICDTLQSKGIDLIVVFAPGKGNFYPEYFPQQYDSIQASTTNYAIFRQEILRTGIHFLDFQHWFGEMKQTAPYPLFPKTGTHWSRYGEILAADSIIKYINASLNGKKVPKLQIGKIETSKKMRFRDDDIEAGMNLMFNISDLEMGYPQFEIQKDSCEQNITALTIADSYFWGMFNMGISKNVFNNGQFWFYNRQIYPESFTSPLHVADINLIEKLEKNDIVILLSTDSNLFRFAFGFIEQLYDEYFGEKPALAKKNIADKH